MRFPVKESAFKSLNVKNCDIQLQLKCQSLFFNIFFYHNFTESIFIISFCTTIKAGRLEAWKVWKVWKVGRIGRLGRLGRLDKIFYHQL